MKIIRISLTVKLFNWVKYIAMGKDGSLWGFKCEPYVSKFYQSHGVGWIPSSVISLCQWFVSGKTMPYFNYMDTLSYIGDKERNQRFVFDIEVPNDSKYIFMNQVGSVFVSKNKPIVRKNNDLWICDDATCVLDSRKECKEWKTSLREIKECNVVR